MRALTWLVIGANVALTAVNLAVYWRLRTLRRRWKAAMRWWTNPAVRTIAERESEHPGIAYTERHALTEGRCPLFIGNDHRPDYTERGWRCGLALGHPGGCLRFGEAALQTRQWWTHE